MNRHRIHSQEFFTSSRDYWWNPDFLQLFVKRWQLTKVRKVLDVGCGQGHWTRTLLPFLSNRATIIGIDKEASHVRTAEDNFRKYDLHDIRFQTGNANSLPFSDGTFDMVTCQTLLIHLEHPKRTIQEMVRVTKPGGLIAVAEPNNAYKAITNLQPDFRVKDVVTDLNNELTYQRGKIAQKNGFDSCGEAVFGEFVKLGLYDLQVYISDKCTPVCPPYETPELKAIVDEMRLGKGPQKCEFDEERERFLLGGGTASQFRTMLRRRRKKREETIRQIEEMTFSAVLPAVMFLTSGRKPVLPQ